MLHCFQYSDHNLQDMHREELKIQNQGDTYCWVRPAYNHLKSQSIHPKCKLMVNNLFYGKFDRLIEYLKSVGRLVSPEIWYNITLPP